MEVQMSDIYTEAEVYDQNEDMTIYLNSHTPITFDNNKWVYHQIPDIATFKEDMKRQQAFHYDHSIFLHLKFEFPVDAEPNKEMLQFLHDEGFNVRRLELYAADAKTLRQIDGPEIIVKPLTLERIPDYMKVFEPIGMEYGADYLIEVEDRLYRGAKYGFGVSQPYVVYEKGEPVGTMKIIESERTVEIDDFEVVEDACGRGIGLAMQAFVGMLANVRPVILQSASDLTVRDMYIKENYQLISFQYSMIKKLYD
ncbi:DUF5613 domain-containing protein [Staphylococcus intermedius]|uniref:GNAT family acetyltransferase n=1 Tax=Staphylococcus intermedius NCTC 11048 TaxID=1141106 RepID=A0A380G4J7_STAIN|nr:DUF5613 domain-containing protein [Staphylococcus intermedius]PCF63727.1 N-acetyltransferase [Staphylococcus intermedius]PCF78442.1 N-acetyltransferase [Staphylococcus intermedius]PCF79416.1 N-acetyltransferase [Staphylococcus intermedius]PNZ50642.1 N-acetyltransferase [Staphylococcus intermedius NCTC 11048]SUM45985.1 GNAT family acetyltransferase [Staphylococcus intermedius NCTC 11048]